MTTVKCTTITQGMVKNHYYYAGYSRYVKANDSLFVVCIHTSNKGLNSLWGNDGFGIVGIDDSFHERNLLCALFGFLFGGVITMVSSH